MRVHRGYLVALAAAILVALAGLIVGGTNHNPQDAQIRAEQAAQARARRHLPAAMAALGQLKVPADFRRLGPGCRWYRCYVVPRPTLRVAPTLPAIMRSIGGENLKTRRLAATVGALTAPRQSEAWLKRLGIREQASRVEGCTTIYNRRGGLWVHCTEPAVIDDNVLVVFLGPYFACPGSRAHCRWTNHTEVDITYPSGSSRG